MQASPDSSGSGNVEHNPFAVSLEVQFLTSDGRDDRPGVVHGRRVFHDTIGRARRLLLFYHVLIAGFPRRPFLSKGHPIVTRASDVGVFRRERSVFATR